LSPLRGIGSTRLCVENNPVNRWGVLALGTAILCAAAFAAGAPAAPRTGATQSPEAVLTVLNRYRASHGLPALVSSATLRLVAGRVLHFDACDGSGTTRASNCVSVDKCPDAKVNPALLRCRVQQALTDLRVPGVVHPLAVWDESDAATLRDMETGVLGLKGKNIGIAYRSGLLGSHDVWILVGQ
jgi:hypothetical protein